MKGCVYTCIMNIIMCLSNHIHTCFPFGVVWFMDDTVKLFQKIYVTSVVNFRNTWEN